MRNPIFLFTLLTLLIARSAVAYPDANGLIDVSIVDQRGQSFREYPADVRHARDESRAYLMAEPGARYAVRVANRSGERVGLVIAIDGRNIVSGKKSKLRHNERMYVLGPYQTATYRGWRTGRDRVNEFYFTSDLDSYAGAFGDYSAMGVVAVAAFRDRYVPEPYYRGHHDQAVPERRRSDNSAGAARGKAESESAPGTGFGDERYAPSRRVEFDARRQSASQVFLKYEWRDTLCRMGVARCHANNNRFWPERGVKRRHAQRGYAAYPPGYRHRETSAYALRYRQ
ncbi:MAG: hypothetical protein AB8G17_08510 [Gammaproteobacteria bacterium]